MLLLITIIRLQFEEYVIFSRHRYVKKIIEDANTSEDTVKLLKFCCWENPLFSSMVLIELLWQIAYSYTYELRPYLDLLLHMLLLDDSWQNHRIHNALKGKFLFHQKTTFEHQREYFLQGGLNTILPQKIRFIYEDSPPFDHLETYETGRCLFAGLNDHTAVHPGL